MKNKNTIACLIFLSIMLISCGKSNPEFSHIVVKSDRLGVLLDSTDSNTLAILQKIFYNKEEQPDAGPEFKFFIDITISGETTRWQYGIDGYIRNYDEGHGMIYLLKDVTEFNRTANIQ
ncbi:MAG: hypothetical protein JKX98_10675 [Alcanivoracaceae bacterium]|nr:hypothetical protein [Alcanivoracaceae bacterium]